MLNCSLFFQVQTEYNIKTTNHPRIRFEPIAISDATIGFVPRNFILRMLLGTNIGADGQDRNFMVAKYLAANPPVYGYSGHFPYVSLHTDQDSMLIRYPTGLKSSEFQRILRMNAEDISIKLLTVNAKLSEKPITLLTLSDEFAIRSRTEMQMKPN